MNNQNNNNTMQVLYCKHSDLKMIRGDITFELCMAVNKILPNQALCAQKLKAVWAICVTDTDAKKTLIRRGIMIKNIQIDLYSENPYSSDSSASERVVIKDLPFWEPNSLITDYLKTVPQITSCSNVYQSKARNNITNETSSFLNGDRFVFVNANIYPPLPQYAQIGNYSCRIRHVSQSRNCIRCRSGSHRTDDVASCPAYVESNDNIVAFSSGILSNFHKCPLTVNGTSFPTSEHLYQWRACTEAIRDDLAELVVKAATPRDAKIIANKINHDKTNWHNVKFDVMREVLRVKAASSKQFRDALLQTGDKILVEARVDDVWGSGLTHTLTMNTDPMKYPGTNKLGVLLGEIRHELRSNLKNPDPESSAATTDRADIPPEVMEDMDVSEPAQRSRRSIRVGSQIRASFLPPSRLRKKKRSTPLIKGFMNQRMKRKPTSPPSTQPSASRARDNDSAASDVVSGAHSSSSNFQSAHGPALGNDVANINDFDSDAEPDNK